MQNDELEHEVELVETTDQLPEDAGEVEVSTDPPPEAEQVQLPTVVVLVERAEDGKIEVDVVAQGDVRATEIETVLKMGLSKWRQKINLPG